MRASIITTDPVNSRRLFDTTVAINNPWRWGVPLFAGCALVVLLLLDANVPLFYFMNRIMSCAQDGLWTHLSLLGDGQFIILFALPFLGRRPDIVWQYILAILLGGLFVQGLKALFSELRPPASLLEGSFHLIGPALEYNSFPSGHTTAAFALAGLVCLQRVHYGIKFAVLVLAIFIGFSRIANGVHWPLDVLGGAFGGWLVAIGSVWLSLYWKAGLKVGVQRVFACILIPLSIWGVWSLWRYLDDVYPGTGIMKIVFLVTSLILSMPGLTRLFALRR
jgi:membrane-associated phospholipid phosphatase